MKTKLVVWGSDEQDGRVLLAIQLFAEQNKVSINTIPQEVVTDELQKQLTDWRNGEKIEIVFPETTKSSERDLSVLESVLPEGYKVDREDVLTRTQTEWQFVVLSAKLHEAYKSELAELSDKVAQVTEYSGELWGALRVFWDKVQGQVKERTLFREHANGLRDTANDLFEQLKSRRTSANNEFEDKSKELWTKFNAALDEIEQKITDGVQRMPDLFEQLKGVQNEFKQSRLSREHSNTLWDRIDASFKVLKEKRFGDNAINDSSALERTQRRYDGLAEAIKKMEESIRRDESEMTFLEERVERSLGQLEAQLRQAKVNMIKERVRSKHEKLNEMRVTRDDLSAKLKGLQEREARKATQRPAKPAVEKAVAPVAEVVETPVVEAIAEPVVEIVETPVVEAIAEPAAEIVETPVVEAIAAPVAEVVETPIVEAIAEPVAEIVETPAVEAIAEPVAEIVETPAVEAIAEPVAEIVATPVVEAIAEPVVEVVATPVVETIDAAKVATIGAAGVAAAEFAAQQMDEKEAAVVVEKVVEKVVETPVAVVETPAPVVVAAPEPEPAKVETPATAKKSDEIDEELQW
ncbi:MAG: hypothetical protein RL757_3060 [Bacteroidota bacterium]